MRRVPLDMLRWLVFAAACGATPPRPIENHRSVEIDDLAFLAGCWERVLDNSGVQRVRWTRDSRGWFGHYEQNGPIDVHVRADLNISQAGRDLEVVTSNSECGSAPWRRFEVKGAINHTVTGYTVFGTEGSALWLGYDQVRSELLFGRAEANRFTRCDAD